ncbi:MAG: UDP-N-acetylmuramate--L-alanine ligase [bacterium]|nr:UDP-N-acetylmuramate--L-alanine ligase [bacterium]
MVGIGGAGMEGLARLLSAKGYRITGSDALDGPVIEALRHIGIAVSHGHDEAHPRGADVVIYSAAVPISNVERQAAARAGIPQLRRAEVLGLLSRELDTISVAGTHGKTTTASLLAAMLRAAARRPTVLVGGWVNGCTQTVHGSEALLLVEADEYDRSFLDLESWLAIVTNIEAEHLDCYADEAELVEAFVTFLQQTRPDGSIVINGDGPLCRQVAERVASLPGSAPVVTFGFAETCDVRATNVSSGPHGTSFDCHDSSTQRRIQLRIPGRHNVANALAACATASLLGIDRDVCCEVLSRFAGVDRRFQDRGQVHGVRVIDDYAHHPTEVAATLAAAREQMGGGRLIAVLQPHTYSRTRQFHAAFSHALDAADRTWVTSVYAAREQLQDGLQSDVIVAGQKIGARALWEADVEKALSAALDSCVAGDWLVVMGAGDIGSRLQVLLQERRA